MSLPSDFIALMRSHLGDAQAEALFRGLQEPPTVSVRFNPQKLAALTAQGLSLSPTLGDPVPWCPDAYYLSGRKAFTFDPLFHAGVYYVQDASSMYLAEVLRKFLPSGGSQSETTAPCPLAALDLCAAPGGKSTLLASSLPEGSLLVSNEPIRKRTQILAENMQKWCAPLPGTAAPAVPVTSIVTQNYPEDFGHLCESFDLLLTDVPCSGEGMFRKDPVAVAEWSLENVRQCALRQRDILQSILPTLKPGGLLVYSTCTFNRFEDEEQARWLVAEYDLQLLDERHFLPGRDRGEGLYIAVLRKPQAAPGEREEPEYLDNLEVLGHLEKRICRTLHPVEPQNVVPSDAPLVPLTYEQAIAYLRHEALRLVAPRGLVAVTYRGLLLGPAKSVGNRLNNLYPQEWRIRTTYSPAEPLPGFFL